MFSLIQKIQNLIITVTVVLTVLICSTRSLDLSSSSTSNQQQIKLEDIERDNLLSERRSNSKESQQILRSSPSPQPTINYQHEIDPQQGGISYARDNSQIEYQYVTQAPSGLQQYINSGEEQIGQPQPQQQQYQLQPQITPVHEADRTYSAPSRHSLISPTLPSNPATHYITPQPQYVYVQAGGAGGAGAPPSAGGIGPIQYQQQEQQQQQQLQIEQQQQQIIQYVPQYIPQ